MSRRPRARKYSSCNASTRSMTLRSTMVESHDFAIARPAHEIAGFVALIENTGAAQRAACTLDVVGGTTRGGAQLHAVEHSPILQRNESARTEQIGGLPNAISRRPGVVAR